MHPFYSNMIVILMSVFMFMSGVLLTALAYRPKEIAEEWWEWTERFYKSGQLETHSTKRNYRNVGSLKYTVPPKVVLTQKSITTQNLYGIWFGYSCQLKKTYLENFLSVDLRGNSKIWPKNCPILIKI